MAEALNPRFSSPGIGFRLAVAAEHPLAVAAALRVFGEGGNAVDASIAASLVLAVTQPHLGGLGGDFFALVSGPRGVFFVDGGGPAPSGLYPELVGESMPASGPLSIVVPGMVDGLYRLWLEGGVLDWARLVEPAIEAAERGYPRHPELERALARQSSLLSGDPGSRALAEALSADVVRLPGLARLLRLISRDPREFYEGDPARRMASYVRSLGGVLSEDDLASYTASIRDTVHEEAFGCRVYEAPPPTQGVTGLHMLRLLEECYSAGRPEPYSRSRAEMHLEAARIAYSARDALLGDPRYMRVSVEEILSLSGAVDGGPRAGSMEGDTTFFIVADEEWVVAGIQSLYNHFGSGVTEPYYQLTLNNRARDFNLEPGHPNSLAPGKRPRHTLSALLAECDDGLIALGASGGNYRPQQHALLFTNIAVYGMDVNEAVNAPRLLWDPASGRIIHEGWDYEGERVPWPSRSTGVAAALRIAGGIRRVYEDPRGVGSHAAY